MQIEEKNFSIIGTRISQSIRDFPFAKAVEKILGKKKFVSFVFVSSAKIKELNSKYRKKNASTDILSFPNPDGGEIFISLSDVRHKAPKFLLLAADYLYFILIHGLLHLKGFDHGSKMEEQEKRFCKFFSIQHPFNVIKDNSRNRYRHIRSARSSRSPRKRDRVS